MEDVNAVMDEFLMNLTDGQILVDTILKVAAQVHDPATTLEPALQVIDTELNEIDGIKAGIDKEADVLRASHMCLKEQINVASEALRQEKVLRSINAACTFSSVL